MNSPLSNFPLEGLSLLLILIYIYPDNCYHCQLLLFCLREHKFDMSDSDSDSDYVEVCEDNANTANNVRTNARVNDAGVKVRGKDVDKYTSSEEFKSSKKKVYD